MKARSDSSCRRLASPVRASVVAPMRSSWLSRRELDLLVERAAAQAFEQLAAEPAEHRADHDIGREVARCAVSR